MENIKGFEVRYDEDASCEHCGQLEAYSAVIVDDGDMQWWCVDCAQSIDDFKGSLDADILKAINKHEAKLKIEHFKERIEKLEGVLHG